MINQLSIKNFKSIKELNFKPKKINIFIGAPNVGKSNILEALSLFSVPYINNTENKFEGLIRFKNLKNLFYDNITHQKVEIKTNIGIAQFRYRENIDKFDLLLNQFSLKEEVTELKQNYSALIKELKQIVSENPHFINSENVKFYFNYFNKKGKELQIEEFTNYFSSIRKYTYNKETVGNQGFHKYILPPNGKNLITIIQKNPAIFDEVASFFEIYGLELLYDIETNTFEIQKKQGKRVYKYPFNLIADTLQRIIFYLTVVETNKNTSILLEEPETHSFPPYTKMLTERIAFSETNQFFITTHSPYLLYNIIENTEEKDRNIIITYYKDYQTKIKVLNTKEVNRIIEDDIEVFFNLDSFLSDE